MLLSEMKTGDITYIIGIKENPDKKRLIEMGFTKGKKVEVVKNSVLYPLVVKLDESRYTINKNLTDYIFVE
jgi:Fe2+ transport system protein FeoA